MSKKQENGKSPKQGKKPLPQKPPVKLTRAEKKAIKDAAARVKRDKKDLSAQDTIPYQRMWPDGICRVDDHYYTKTIQFQDINYQLCTNDAQKTIFEDWSRFWDYFDSSISVQLSCINLPAPPEYYNRSIRIPRRTDGFANGAAEYGAFLRAQAAKGNRGLLKNKYLTIGIHAENLKAAEPRLERIEVDVMNNFKRLGVRAEPQNGAARLSVLHSICHMDTLEPFHFKWEMLPESGMTTKDFIAPSSFEFRTKRQFEIGSKLCAVSCVNLITEELNDRALTDLLEMESAAIVTLHVHPVDQVKAIKMARRTVTNVDRDKIDQQKKAWRNGYDIDILSPELVSSGKAAQQVLNSLQSRNQRMFLVTLTILNTGNDQKELDNNILQTSGLVQKCNCTLIRLDWRQEQGFVNSLPLGLNQLRIDRALTTGPLSVLMPFTTQELWQPSPEALYYGVNAMSNNIIMVDRKWLGNANGLILGVPGSGKSFAAKREIVNVYLVTSDDIIICDPESEYTPVVSKIGGQVVRLSPTGKDHDGNPCYINPMDINLNYSDDDNPLSLKIDFILSLCELILSGKEGLQPVERTVIDRCARLVYLDYLNDPRPENMPILEDLYNLLRIQVEPEAQNLATALEIYVTGSLNMFNHRTNVDTENRVVCYDIKDLGKQLKKLGMLIVQDQVWNRVTINRAQHRSTRYYIDEFHWARRSA